MSFEREDLPGQIPTSVNNATAGVQKKSNIILGMNRLQFMNKGEV